MKQQNKIIVVGATSGLGRMLAERYIRDGHVVGIVGRRGDKLAEVAKGHSEVHCLKADVTDIGQSRQMHCYLADIRHIRL